MSAKYWIAQMVEDVFRNEPRNVGVFVSRNGEIAARFLGEVGDQIDGRKLRGLSHPEVYKQWVSYWRKALTTSATIEPLVRSSGSHYRVVIGGELTDVLQDGAEDVATYLYSLLVSEGGFREAMGGETEDATVVLESDLSQEFRLRNIFGDVPQLPHPVRKGITVLGSGALQHKPAFVQENGRLFIMETVDFTIHQKRRSRDHAGLSAYMFKDLRAVRSNVEPIAVVKTTDDELALPDVDYAMKLLANESRIVNWLDQRQKRAFLDERENVALG